MSRYEIKQLGGIRPPYQVRIYHPPQPWPGSAKAALLSPHYQRPQLRVTCPSKPTAELLVDLYKSELEAHEAGKLSVFPWHTEDQATPLADWLLVLLQSRARPIYQQRRMDLYQALPAALTLEMIDRALDNLPPWTMEQMSALKHSERWSVDQASLRQLDHILDEPRKHPALGDWFHRVASRLYQAMRSRGINS